jgi:hypothetical protein
MPAPDDIFSPEDAPSVNGDTIIVGPRSIVVLLTAPKV